MMGACRANAPPTSPDERDAHSELPAQSAQMGSDLPPGLTGCNAMPPKRFGDTLGDSVEARRSG